MLFAVGMLFTVNLLTLAFIYFIFVISYMKDEPVVALIVGLCKCSMFVVRNYFVSILY